MATTIWLICAISLGWRPAPQLSIDTVIQSLHKQRGYGDGDGWELGRWLAVLNLIDPKMDKLDPVVCVRPYLIHRIRGHVITCQGKGWMDAAGMAMWIELVVGPWASKSERKKLLVLDDVSCHKVPCFAEIFAKYNITVAYLTANTTDDQQVMDIIVNGPCRAYIRAARVASLYEQFQVWRDRTIQHQIAGGPEVGEFIPASPTLGDLLNTLLRRWMFTWRRQHSSMASVGASLPLASCEEATASYRFHWQTPWPPAQ